MEYDEHISLIESEEKADEMKKRLDMYMNMYHWAKAFIVDEVLDRDEMFYSDIDDIYNILENIVPLYNRVRNYVTQKPYNSKKIKLNFQSPTLANGWSQSKEFDNNAIILIRDNKYYLAIFNAKINPIKRLYREILIKRTIMIIRRWYIICCRGRIKCFLKCSYQRKE